MPGLEVVKRRLRIADPGPAQVPARPAAPAEPEPVPVALPVPEPVPVALPMPEPVPSHCPCCRAQRSGAGPCHHSSRRDAGNGGCAAAAEAEPDATSAADPVGQAVLDIVAGLTGYPRDLLDLDLDLEADLGIDTVKQAEVFAAVRERFGIPREEKLRLRDFPTLAHVIGFVRDRAPAAPQPAPPHRAAAAAPAAQPAPAAPPAPAETPAAAPCR